MDLGIFSLEKMQTAFNHLKGDMEEKKKTYSGLVKMRKVAYDKLQQFL